ncbi:MAG: radical SAM protein, partial [Anaerolineae bacterium]
YVTYYAPGCLCVVDPRQAERFEASIAPHQNASAPHRGRDWGSELRRCATRAVQEAERQRTEPFQPECLTLYLNNECNLRCTYCYAAPSPGPAERLDLKTVAAAADVVAESCQQKGRPLYAVFHGGGEPTLHHEQLETTLALVEAAARAHDVELFRYVATNGILSAEKVAWLADHFDLIGLSCDGPAGIHDQQRLRADGSGSLEIVERTARILHEEGARLHVRATVTADSLLHQAEMAEYICRQLAPEEIHFEPVYLGGRTGAADSLCVDQAEAYVTHFLAARRAAWGYDVPLLSSGSRPGAIHGPYCNIFRQVLNLAPGGLATACFKLSRAAEIRDKGAAIHVSNPATGRFEIDRRRLRTLRRRLGAVPSECQACFNRYHCVRNCPDRCPLDGSSSLKDHFEPGFRCHVQKATTLAILTEEAGRLWSNARKERGPHGTRDLGFGAT